MPQAEASARMVLVLPKEDERYSQFLTYAQEHGTAVSEGVNGIEASFPAEWEASIKTHFPGVTVRS